MEMTEEETKELNNISKGARTIKKRADRLLKENSKSNKLRRQETADSEECTTEVPKS